MGGEGAYPVLFGSLGVMGVGRGRVACPVLFGSLREWVQKGWGGLSCVV